MKNELKALLLFAALFGWACSEDVKDTTLPQEVDMGSQGTDGSVDSDAMTTQFCIADRDCSTLEYCRREGSGRGTCETGCRDDDSCSGDQICDEETRECKAPPCMSDDECSDETTYCDVESGACKPGCRLDPDNCEPNPENLRDTFCDEDTRVCTDLAVCCDGSNQCSTGTIDSCEGQVLLGAQSCDQNPCGEPCESDAECGDDLGRFCNLQDGLCRDGCRLEEQNGCEAGQTCDTASRFCIDLPCLRNTDCPDTRYCDFRGGSGLCNLGCRDDDSCGNGELCEDNTCTRVCSPDDPTTCPEGQYCDARNRCADRCNSHDDCERADFRCNAVTQQCEAGCRDDEGIFSEPNDTPEDAITIELSDVPAGCDDGTIEGEACVQYGTVDAMFGPSEQPTFILCDNNPDVFRVDVGPGKRIRVSVTYSEPGAPGFSIRGEGPGCTTTANCADNIGWFCDVEAANTGDQICRTSDAEETLFVENVLTTSETIEYPPLLNDGGAGSVVNHDSTYYITINPAAAQIFGYRVEVAVADANTACFPDSREVGQGDDERVTGTVIDLTAGNEFTFEGTVCGDDEDWFQLDLAPNDGLNIDLISLGGDDVDLYLMSATEANHLRVASTNDSDSPNELPLNYLLGEGNFGGLWHLGVKSRDGSASYSLSVFHTPSELCQGADQGDGWRDDASDPPAQITPMLDMEEAYDVSEELNEGTQICSDDPTQPDRDNFCFVANAGELIEAWIETAGMGDTPGLLQVQFADDDGVFLGSTALSTRPSSEPDKAKYAINVGGIFCASVSGVGNGSGQYNLFVTRSESEDDECALDFAEEVTRNDRGDSATELMSMVEDATLYSFDDGYICDANTGSDEDWYVIDVPSAGSSVCVMARGFDGRIGDVDLDVYPAATAGSTSCANQNACDIGDGGACVPSADEANVSRCTPHVGTASSVRDFEMVNLSRLDTQNIVGPLYVRVSHNDTNEGPYSLIADVVPNNGTCADDRFEPNSAANEVTDLGAGETGICGAWLCDESSDAQTTGGDWYSIEVPAGQDRTILIDYSDLEGTIAANVEALNHPEVNGFSWQFTGGRQCILVRGGTSAQQVNFNLSHAGDVATANGNNRIDYSVRVLDTDLDDLSRPVGFCDEGFETLMSVTERCEANAGIDNQDFDCWPYLVLP